MKLRDITKMDKNDLLGMLGLETKGGDGSRMLSTLGIFGIGLLLGAGAALLLAPKTGRQLRHDLRPRFRRDGRAETVSDQGRDGVGAQGPMSSPL